MKGFQDKSLKRGHGNAFAASIYVTSNHTNGKQPKGQYNEPRSAPPMIKRHKRNKNTSSQRSPRKIDIRSLPNDKLGPTEMAEWSLRASSMA